MGKLAPRGAGKHDFGTSVAISANGRVALVGAPGTADGKGSAWVYSSSGGGVWVGTRLPSRDAKGTSRFGFAVALSADGKRAVVGGPGDDKDKGAVWMFHRSGSLWKQSGGKITGRGAIRKARFGAAVAISYESAAAIVGGPGDAERGAVWFYSRSGSVWKQQASKISGVRNAAYGSAVALSGDGYTAVVGAPGDNNGGGAWVLRRAGSTWKSERITGAAPSFERQRLFFGRAVAISADGQVVAVGSGDTPNVVLTGGLAHFFSRTQSGWREQLPALLGASQFGASISLSYDATIALVGRTDPDDRKPWCHVFSPRPAVIDVEPRSAPLAGGTEVTLTGRNFLKVLRVTFGAVPASSFMVVSPTQLKARAPQASAGTVHVHVTNAFGTSPEETPGLFGGTSTLFTYVAPPTVTAISPSSGPPAGGTQVTITGTGLSGATAARFGSTPSMSFTVVSDTQVRAVSPAGAAGSVSVSVTTPFGTSTPNSASQFTYVSPATVIGFDNLTTGGPGQTLVPVTTQYAGQGVTFNSPRAIDYSKGAAIPGFARSGTVAIEHCVGVEFCTTPIVGTFATPKTMTRVWVGFSFQLNQPILAQLRAYNAGGTIIDSDAAILPARSTPTPISIPLEVNLPSATIARIEVSVSGGFNNALAVDDVTFEG